MPRDAHFWLFVGAAFCFVLAFLPLGWKVRPEWLGLALIVLAYIV